MTRYSFNEDPSACGCFFDGWSQMIRTGCRVHNYSTRDEWLGKGAFWQSFRHGIALGWLIGWPLIVLAMVLK